jgi:ribosomal protein S18 acetylase RimI-like enzyme
MSAEAIHLREARPSDLESLASLFLACWQVSYAGVLPDHVIAMFDDDSSRALWHRVLETPNAGSVGIVAEQPSRGVVGIIRLGSDPDEATSGHVFSLYVDPATQGQGVGRTLLDEADRRFRDAGLAQATLWVFAANTAARAFYQQHGWQPDGGQRVEPEYGEPEVRLRRTLD